MTAGEYDIPNQPSLVGGFSYSLPYYDAYLNSSSANSFQSEKVSRLTYELAVSLSQHHKLNVRITQSVSKLLLDLKN